MLPDLSSVRPLWDLAAVLFVLGIAGDLTGRDPATWWLSQGSLLLSFLVGVAADNVWHSGVDLFSLGIWIPVAWIASWIGSRRLVRASKVSELPHD